jgi:hypothetical protein
VGDDVNIQGLMIEIRAEYYKKKSYTTWVHKKVQIATKALSINYVDENRRGKIRQDTRRTLHPFKLLPGVVLFLHVGPSEIFTGNAGFAGVTDRGIGLQEQLRQDARVLCQRGAELLRSTSHALRQLECLHTLIRKQLERFPRSPSAG